MKAIRKLSNPTPGLTAYAEDCANGEANWEGFRDHAASASYRELVRVLVTLQRALCGYCEIDLTETDRQVEHVIPRSDPHLGASVELNHGNMIACCLGGTARNFHSADATGDEDRFLEPSKRNISCGQAKGDTFDAEFVDPRTLPPLPAVAKVYPNGKMSADREACERCRVSADSVNRTIAILGLNVERLRVARQKHWTALDRTWIDDFDDPAAMELAARSELLPGDDGLLPRFFTTNRSYFAPYGERILQQDTSEWV